MPRRSKAKAALVNASRIGVAAKASRSSKVAKKFQTVIEQSMNICACEIEVITETLEPSSLSVVTDTVVAHNFYQPLHVTSEVSNESVANDKSLTQTCFPSKRRRTDVGSQRIYASRRRSNAAEKYGSKYHSELRFLRCGCCLREDSSSKFVELAKIKENGCDILKHLGQMKKYFIINLRGPDASVFDKRYADVYQAFVDEEGIAANAQFLCIECYRDLKKVCCQLFF
jgi:hypothetical protein